MKRAILAFTIATIAILGSGSAALAAPAASQTMSFTGYANFNSILGGNLNGPATVSGDINDGNLGDLRVDVNFPLRDMSLTISPVDVLPLTTQELSVQWNRVTCDPFYGCSYTYGFSTFNYQRVQGPVTIKAGSLHGTGTFSAQTTATCVSSCPPAGSWWSAPSGYSNLNGALTSSKEAGFLNINGGAPDIR